MDFIKNHGYPNTGDGPPTKQSTAHHDTPRALSSSRGLSPPSTSRPGLPQLQTTNLDTRNVSGHGYGYVTPASAGHMQSSSGARLHNSPTTDSRAHPANPTQLVNTTRDNSGAVGRNVPPPTVGAQQDSSHQGHHTSVRPHHDASSDPNPTVWYCCTCLRMKRERVPTAREMTHFESAMPVMHYLKSGDR